jgi:DNA repair exonuclease SbcCD nuclease subunit
MKILLIGDAHFCKRSSIINKFGTKYPVRLENQIQTFGWIKEQAIKNNCGMVIGLGDLFDSSQLSDVEITAAKELPFAELPTYLIVGNHEASSQDLTFSSTKVLEADNRYIVSEPSTLLIDESTEICFLPYITESERKPIAEYFPHEANCSRIILSHNDIKGINYGPVISAVGFEIADIEANCDLYINAHIHNGQKITDKIYNIGNITGQNFSESADKYSHNIIILDTKDLSVTHIENPYAYNFYKLQIDNESDIVCLDSLKNNAVLSIKCEQSLVELVKQKIGTLNNIVESRLIITKNYIENTEVAEEIDLSVDHLARFIDYCKATIENTTILEEEIAEVCK